MGLEDARYHLVCRNRCGFVVHDRYFALKTQFEPGICPRCNGGVDVCERYGGPVIREAYVGTDPGKVTDFRRVVIPE